MEKNKSINRGASILSFLCLLAFFILGLRILYIQITGKADAHLLVQEAEKKYTSHVVIPGKRGTIQDSKGKDLVNDSNAYDLVAILDKNMKTNDGKPLYVNNPQDTAKKLAPILKMNEQEILKILSKDKDQVEFGSKGRKLSIEAKMKIDQLELPGIGFKGHLTRYYPNGDFASHTLGMTTKKQDNYSIGISGLEKQLNNYLIGKDGYIEQSKDKYGYVIPMRKTKVVPEKNGHTIKLTIDQNIQNILELSMDKIQKKNSPKKMIGIISEAKTGKILAMSTRPSYDPNKNNITYFNNDAISYAFEPGSTMKMFTLASAIEEKVYSGEEMFKSGRLKVKGSKNINDHNNGRGWGNITFNEGVQRSSNVAMALLTKKMGAEKLHQYLGRFGFTNKTGIDLPSEGDSKINFQYERDQLSVSFGQGLAITPIQQIQAASAIANNGKMMKPYVVNEIVDSNNHIIMKQEPKIVSKPISEETANKTLEILETVVSSKNGTGKLFSLSNYKVAGKTGTAQIYENGKYIQGQGENIFSFLGLAPADHPKLIVYIAIQQPKLQEGESGTILLSKIFNPSMEKSLKYLSVHNKNEMNKINEKYTVVSFSELEPEIATKILNDNDINYIILGEGDTIIEQRPEEGENVLKSENILLKTNGKVKMPDINGWSGRDVYKLSSILNVHLKMEGNGYVVHQSIKPGTVLTSKERLVVKFKTKDE